MAVPSSGVSTLQTTWHDHELPICAGSKHNRMCKRYKRESECLHIIVRDPQTRKTIKEYARCFHFYIK